jgi:hypothetical protein
MHMQYSAGTTEERNLMLIQLKYSISLPKCKHSVSFKANVFTAGSDPIGSVADSINSAEESKSKFSGRVCACSLQRQ